MLSEMLSPSSLRAAALLAFVVGLTGCARRPLVDNSTGYTTWDLVDKIRCEMAYAVFQTTRLELERNPAAYRVGPGDLETIQQGLIILRKPEREKLSQNVRRLLDIFGKTAIVYDFEFDITVRNLAVGAVGLRDPFGINLLTGGAVLSTDLKRRNKRNFRIEETYEKLLANIPPGCTDRVQLANWDSKNRPAYPITNSLGLRETAETFWQLYQTRTLSSDPEILASAGDKSKAAPRVVDQIEYTTKFEAGVGASAEFGPIGDRLRLTPVSATTTNSREDIHTLIVAIGMSSDGSIAEAFQTANEGVDNRIQRNGLRVLERLDDRLN